MYGIQSQIGIQSHYSIDRMQPPAPVDTDSSPSSGWQPPGPLTPTGSSVTVAIQGVDFDYQLTEGDIKKVLGRYGRLQAVELNHPVCNVARVWFSSNADAEVAVKDLNGKVLNSVHGRLSVEWTGGRSPMDQSLQDSIGKTSPDPDVHSSPEFASMHPHEQHVRKYTCRFEIGIDNDKEFQVARRIIGQKGSNMKRIVKATDAKLRLRGRGSGYLEGAAKVESPEPLHLCISCVNSSGYKQAVQLVSELLAGVYEEYKRFCRAKGADPSGGVGLNVKEYPLIIYGGSGGDFDGDEDTPTPPHDMSAERDVN